MSIPTATAIAAALGILSHLFYFRVGEHHLYGWRYLGIFLTSCVGATISLTQTQTLMLSIEEAAVLTSRLALSWLCGVYGSLLFYRLYWAPINKFPGPWQARISTLWFTSQLSKFDGYHRLQALHAKYGPCVRIGSHDISIADADAVQVTYDAQSPAIKGEWYDEDRPTLSLQATRDKPLHNRRRRVWAPAFSDRAVYAYEDMVKVFNEKFTKQMQNSAGQPVNVQKWFNLYGFDVMGRLAFGRDYYMLDSGDRHEAIDVLSRGLMFTGYRLPSWATRMLIDTPGLASSFKSFIAFANEQLAWRVKNDDPNKNADITSWILKAYENVPHPEKDPFLGGDTRLMIIAGSDTTSAALTFLFFELAKRPSEVEKIRKELQDLIGDRSQWSDRDLKHAAHLNGAINEVLRLHPPVPSGMQRKTPKQGLTLGSTFIPGGTHFWIPQYVLGRDENNFEKPEEFIPERWYSKPEMIKHSHAFVPFSMGPFNCIGKNLAYLELRTLTAQLLLRFNIALAPGEDGHRLLYESKDHFTMTLGALDLIFTELDS